MPVDMEKFAILLAAHLLGKEALLGKKPGPFRLYWRSPLLLQSIFVDITFHFEKHSIAMCFGGLNGSSYHAGKPLTEKELDAHFGAAAIDTPTTDASVLAKSMATALQALSLKEKDDVLALFYSEMNASAPLEIWKSPSDPIAEPVLQMLLMQAVASRPARPVDSAELESVLDYIRNEWKPQILSPEKPAKASLPTTTTSSSAGDKRKASAGAAASATAATKTSPTKTGPRKKKKSHGRARINDKRR